MIDLAEELRQSMIRQQREVPADPYAHLTPRYVRPVQEWPELNTDPRQRTARCPNCYRKGKVRFDAPPGEMCGECKRNFAEMERENREAAA